MMGKRKKKNKKRRRSTDIQVPEDFLWQDKEGLHAIIPGLPPTPEQLKEMTKKYHESIRKSPLWDEMVSKFGIEKSEELLKQFQIKID